MLKKSLIYIAIFIALPAVVHADQPMAVLKQSIDKGMHLLNDPRYKDPGQRVLLQSRLNDILHQIFDFREFSRLTIAVHWQKFKPLEKQKFVDVFSSFLSTFYLKRLQQEYTNEKIVYLGQELKGDSSAVVTAHVFWKNLNIPVQIRMLKRQEKWKAYDVMVLGVSAVRNYRVQFNAVLQKETPAQVIERLEEKIRQLQTVAQIAMRPGK